MQTKTIEWTLRKINVEKLSFSDQNTFHGILTKIDSIKLLLKSISRYDQLSLGNHFKVRKGIILVSKKTEGFLKEHSGKALPNLPQIEQSILKSNLKKFKSTTEYAPRWVILLVSLSLGLGTMIGWKRIVVTIGEKIGKSHLTYAQGASAEIVAASTIGVSSMFGLPVSTTHVLSSGIAGTMVAGGGRQNLHIKMVQSIAIAWLITLPVTILLSGSLFLLLRWIMN
jgi:PiT family inorganic phosphate transporter